MTGWLRVDLDDAKAAKKTWPKWASPKKEMAPRPPGVNPRTYWVVLYECIFQVVWVSPDGEGFFAPGQSPLWSFDAVAEWICEVEMPDV
jgi:hypothetical protein